MTGDGFGMSASAGTGGTDIKDDQRKKVMSLKKRFLKNPALTSATFAKREARKKIMREVGPFDFCLLISLFLTGVASQAEGSSQQSSGNVSQVQRRGVA